MSENMYDLAIIGAGPAGYEAASCAARLGRRTAVIECCEIGGTCLNRGCIPTKVLLHASGLYRQVKNGATIGINGDAVEFDISKMNGRKEEVIRKLTKGVEYILKSDKIDVYQGMAKIMEPGCLLVTKGEESREIRAERILIAAGGKPAVLPLEGCGLPGVMTSDDLLDEFDRIFNRLAIIGGGVIGLEFASIYSDLGCEVSVIEAMDRILPAMDPEIGQTLAGLLKRRGIRLFTSARVERITDEDGLAVHFSERDKPHEIKADGILIAAGRKPSLEALLGSGIRLEMSGGFIKVDDDFRTSIPGIYAVGDVIGGMQLAHLAAAQGSSAVLGMFGAERVIELSAIPACVYTDPEIAAVGLTYEEAVKRGYEAKSTKYQMISNGRSVIEAQDRGFVKVIYDSQTGAILGAHMIGGRASDLISEFTSAICAGLTVKQLASSIRPHPTFSEGISKVLEAALENDFPKPYFP